MSNTKHNRYPGVKPFVESENSLFFGRDNDIEDILDLILVEKLVVLFGKSGYGKSSLLNAGVLPQLEKGMIPIFVRLGAYTNEKTQTPLENVKARLEEKLPKDTQETAFLEKLTEEKTLWYHFKRKQTTENPQFLLIFDQFEEFESYPETEKQAFKTQLAELLYVNVPQKVRNAAEDLGENESRQLAKALQVKAIFAVRSDRMAILDYLKDKLPAILYKRYELKALTPKQAREAITKPAKLTGDFGSLPFSYSEEALSLILSELSKTQKATTETIEAFQLQILCEYIEGIAREKNTQNLVIQRTDVPDIANIYEKYYQNKLQQLPENERNGAQAVIEDGLLYEDVKSGEARRLSVDSEELVSRFSEKCTSQTLLKNLESTFLLRREANTLGGYNYEICHDTLIKPILASKRIRKEEEMRLENERKQKEAEKKALLEENKRKEAERLKDEAISQKKRAQLVSFVAVIFLFIAVIAVFIAYQKQTEVENTLKKVEEEKAKAVATLQKLNKAELARLENEFSQLGGRIEDIKEAEGDTLVIYRKKDTMQRKMDSLRRELSD